MIRSTPILLAMCGVMIGSQANAQSIIDRTRDSFPTFDPNYQTRQTEENKVPASHATRPRLRSIPPAKPKPEVVTTREPLESLEPETDSEVINLPEMTVETRALPSVQLPRLVAPTPQKEVKAEPFISTEAKAELMVEKHHSVFDRLFLNRFDIFGSNKARAAEAEDRAQFAHAMNSIAEGIEQADVWGLTEEEKKQLKKEYLELLNSRPQ
jgi:hypothetical protein